MNLDKNFRFKAKVHKRVKIVNILCPHFEISAWAWDEEKKRKYLHKFCKIETFMRYRHLLKFNRTENT